MLRTFCIGSGIALLGLSLVGTAVSVAASAAFYTSVSDIPLVWLMGLIVSGAIAVLGFIVPILAGNHKALAAAGAIGLLVACAIDATTNFQAINADVLEEKTAKAEALASFNANTAALTTARQEVSRLDTDLAILRGTDVRAKQELVGVVPDGKFQGKTEAAVQAHKVRAERLRDEQAARIAALEAATADGPPSQDLMFSTEDAMVRGIGLTLIPLALSFFGGLLCTVGRKTALQVADETVAGVLDRARSGLDSEIAILGDAEEIFRRLAA